MSRNLVSSKVSLAICGAVVALSLCASAVGAQICGPLDNGRVADVVYKDNAVFFSPIVRYEYDRAILTISGPCEEIVKTFKPGEEIYFDLSQVKRTLDGHYTWQLRFTPTIDSGVREALEASRGTGKEDDVWWLFWQKGAISAGPSVDSASFSVVDGTIIDPTSGEESEKSATLAARSTGGPLGSAALAAAPAATGSAAGDGATLAPKDFVINDDLIVDGSACIGFDCVSGESFGFDTIRLKENNLRIKFDDTSTAASFPRNDWQLTANDSANGGKSKFSIDDISGARTPFTVEAGAPSHSLYVDDGGRLGLGTSTPSTEIHVVDGDTPTLRLQQDGSSGFAPQTWDVAGNETSFFIRDATNGSTLPFRIRPGAGSNALVIDTDDDIGIGTLSPDAPLHVFSDDSIGSDGQVHIENTNTTATDRNLLRLENNGPPTLFFSNTNAGSNGSWTYTVTNGGVFQINASGSGAPIELQLSAGGNMTIGGMLTENSSRTVKTGFEALDPQQVLDRVSALPVTSWSYTADETGTRHIGPMAEDFYAAFGVGVDSHHIAPSDKAGVALVAIQGLQKMVEQRDQEVAELKRDKADLEKRVEALEALVTGPRED